MNDGSGKSWGMTGLAVGCVGQSFQSDQVWLDDVPVSGVGFGFGFGIGRADVIV